MPLASAACGAEGSPKPITVDCFFPPISSRYFRTGLRTGSVDPAKVTPRVSRMHCFALCVASPGMSGYRVFKTKAANFSAKYLFSCSTLPPQGILWAFLWLSAPYGLRGHPCAWRVPECGLRYERIRP